MAAVHTATLELLAETGYESLQLPDVAKRAQVNKTTVYRRWPTKAALVADLLTSFTQRNVATPDTGSLQGDLEKLLADIVTALADRAVRAVLYGALAGADDSDDVRTARARFWEERFRRSGAVVERAITRAKSRPARTRAQCSRWLPARSTSASCSRRTPSRPTISARPPGAPFARSHRAER